MLFLIHENKNLFFYSSEWEASQSSGQRSPKTLQALDNKWLDCDFIGSLLFLPIAKNCSSEKKILLLSKRKSF